jgi:hypothetical protein
MPIFILKAKAEARKMKWLAHNDTANGRRGIQMNRPKMLVLLMAAWISLRTSGIEPGT